MASLRLWILRCPRPKSRPRTKARTWHWSPNRPFPCRLRPAARIDEGGSWTDLALLSKASWGYEPALRGLLPQGHGRHGLGDPAPALRGGRGFRPAAGFFHGFGRKDELNLDWLFVHPDHLGKGIGKRSVPPCRDLGRGAGWAEMMIVADPHAEDFYRHLGFPYRGRQAVRTLSQRYLPVLRYRLA